MRDKTLCINIGNTSSKFAFFHQNKILNIKTFKTADMTRQDLGPVLSGIFFNSCIMAGVVKDKIDLLSGYFSEELPNIRLIITDHSMIKNVSNHYDPPSSIGIDRLITASYCYCKSKRSIIIFDFGTATTSTMINCKGGLIGGTIMPGINTQLQSLSHHTSLLPSVEAGDPSGLIPNNTKDAILSGIILNTAFFVINYTKYASEHGLLDPYIFLTGGFCGFVFKYIKILSNNQFNASIDSNLGLKALYGLYKDQIAY